MSIYLFVNVGVRFRHHFTRRESKVPSDLQLRYPETKNFCQNKRHLNFVHFIAKKLITNIMIFLCDTPRSFPHRKLKIRILSLSPNQDIDFSFPYLINLHSPNLLYYPPTRIIPNRMPHSAFAPLNKKNRISPKSISTEPSAFLKTPAARAQSSSNN